MHELESGVARMLGSVITSESRTRDLPGGCDFSRDEECGSLGSDVVSHQVIQREAQRDAAEG